MSYHPFYAEHFRSDGSRFPDVWLDFSSFGPIVTPDRKNLAGEPPRFVVGQAHELTVGGYLEARVRFSPCLDWLGAGIALTDAPDPQDAVILWVDNVGRTGLHAGADSPGPPAAGSRSTDDWTDLWLRLTWLSANTFRGESRAERSADWQAVGADLVHTLTPTRQAPGVILNWPWRPSVVDSFFFREIKTGRA